MLQKQLVDPQFVYVFGIDDADLQNSSIPQMV
jgi:hypothetical protein